MDRAVGALWSVTWATPKEYADYYRMLLTHSGRREFKWWLERENPGIYQVFCKEVATYESALDRKRRADAVPHPAQSRDLDDLSPTNGDW